MSLFESYWWSPRLSPSWSDSGQSPVGYVKQTAAGYRVWTYDVSHRPLADLVEQCLRYA